MKIVLNVALVLHLLAELLAALALVFGPDGVSVAGRGDQWSMHYGFAALAIASVSAWVWPYRTHLPTITTALGVLVVFHTGVFISLTLAGDQQGGMILHGILAPLFILLFLRRRSWCHNV